MSAPPSGSRGALASAKRFLTRHQPQLLARLLRVKSNWNRELFVFLHLVRRGDVALDVGANAGLYTQVFSDLVGKDGQVHAFEPVPPTFAQLSAQFQPPQDWPQLHLHAIALGEQAGPVVMHLPDDDSGQASLRPQQGASWTNPRAVQQFQCKGETLDGFVRAAGVPRVDFVKIDVEGAELLVLRGSAQTLRQHEPMIFLEAWDNWMRAFGYTPQDLARVLTAAGYDRFLAVSDRLVPLPDLEEAWEHSLARGSQNLLAAKSSRHAERLGPLWRHL